MWNDKYNGRNEKNQGRDLKNIFEVKFSSYKNFNNGRVLSHISTKNPKLVNRW